MADSAPAAAGQAHRNHAVAPALVLSGAQAVAALADPQLGLTPHPAFTARLADRLGLDLSATLQVMAHLPLWHEGDAHADLRARTAAFLARGRSRIADDLPALARGHWQAALAAPERIDLRRAVTGLVDEMLARLTGLPLADAFAGGRPGRIFSSNLGVADRLALEAGLKQLVAVAEAVPPDVLHADERLIAVAQWLMGRDSMSGTFALSLARHLRALDGAPLASRPLPRVPTDTGVPVIGRIAPASSGVAAGGLVECRLDSLAGGEPRDRLRFSGAGPHTCLGRALALDLWAALATAVDDTPHGLRITDLQMQHDDVFDQPEVFLAERT
jgi:hypothetical protein